MEEDMNPQVQPVTNKARLDYATFSPQIKEEPTPKIDPFENEMSKFVYYRTYSRWDDAKGRRETWDETVNRCVDYLKKVSKNKLKKSDYELIHKYILEMKVMPSMRLLWTAGKPATLNNLSLIHI